MTAIPAGTPSGRDLDVGELRELVAGSPPIPGGGGRSCAPTPPSATSSSSGSTTTSTSGSSRGRSGNDTGFHDHDLSYGAVAVVQGEIIEERLVVGGPPRQLPHRAGETFGFDASHVHRMRKDDAALAVSIHAYSPPLSRMGAYEVDADGTLRRRSISSRRGAAPVGAAA